MKDCTGRFKNFRLPNPARGDTRPAVTDRALRYRAQRNPPEGPELCAYCGAHENVDIEHVDGFEENTEPENLLYACRSCNTQKGIVFKEYGMGRATRQYNPGHVTRPKTLKERLEYLAKDARRILAAPTKHRPEEVAWAKDMLASEKRKGNPSGAGSLTQWKAAVASVMGLGPMKPAAAVRTIQATPGAKRAAYARQLARKRNPEVPTIAQYARAVSIHTLGEHDEGGAIIHATPKALRSEYARTFARNRGKRAGSYDDVPF